jgi:ribose transport system ATP-binding protein
MLINLSHGGGVLPLTGEVVLEVKGITKSFDATKALRGVDFQLRKGEIHALVGENGAGKSTLMNIIDGVFLPDAGEIYVDGKQVHIRNPHEAQEYGIGLVHQEIALCPHVTVAENILMSAINNSKRLMVSYKKLYDQTIEILKPLADINPRKNVSELSVSNQQVVEIAKALSMNCKILILDEPTSALTENETEALFKIMRDLKKRGIGIIYISHRMAEVFGECDRVSILRDGCYMGTHNIKETNTKTVVNQMVGREITDLYPPKRGRDDKTGDLLFEVRNFSDGNRFHNISFQLKEGEILGLAGLVGAGRSEVAQAVCGLRPRINGEVYYKGKKIKNNTSTDSIENGIVYLTEDRKSLGIFLELAIKKNISAMKVDNIAKYGIIDNKLEDEQGNSFVKTLGIKCRSIDQNASSLSGGNQQKVLISKLLTVKPKIVFMDEPTRGIDVGAKSEIHKLLRELANQGTGIVMISSELPEVIGMCDRVMVMHEGRLSGEVSSEDLNERKIIQLASGIKD